MSKGSSTLFHKVGTFDMVDCYEFSFEWKKKWFLLAQTGVECGSATIRLEKDKDSTLGSIIHWECNPFITPSKIDYSFPLCRGGMQKLPQSLQSKSNSVFVPIIWSMTEITYLITRKINVSHYLGCIYQLCEKPLISVSEVLHHQPHAVHRTDEESIINSSNPSKKGKTERGICYSMLFTWRQLKCRLTANSQLFTLPHVFLFVFPAAIHHYVIECIGFTW